MWIAIYGRYYGTRPRPPEAAYMPPPPPPPAAPVRRCRFCDAVIAWPPPRRFGIRPTGRTGRKYHCSEACTIAEAAESRKFRTRRREMNRPEESEYLERRAADVRAYRARQAQQPTTER